jgi:hypothetical protein
MGKIKRVKAEAISRSKYTIGVNENMADLAGALRELGYTVWVPENGVKGSEVDRQLRALGIRYFITNDLNDFQAIQRSSCTPYFLIGVQKNHEGVGLARIVERYLTRYHKWLPRWGGCMNLTQGFVNKNLRKTRK